MKYIILMYFIVAITSLVRAETTSVWGDDGSLTIIQSVALNIDPASDLANAIC